MKISQTFEKQWNTNIKPIPMVCFPQDRPTVYGVYMIISAKRDYLIMIRQKLKDSKKL